MGIVWGGGFEGDCYQLDSLLRIWENTESHIPPETMATSYKYIYIQLLTPHIYHHLLCAACNQHYLYKTCGSYMVCPLCKLHWLLHQALPMVPVHALVLIWSVVAAVVVACCWCITLQLVLMLVLTFSNFWRCNPCQL